jgi:hypothetical protein
MKTSAAALLLMFLLETWACVREDSESRHTAKECGSGPEAVVLLHD